MIIDQIKFAFLLEYPALYGGGKFFVEREQYEKYKDKPIELVALYFGVSVSEYLRWIEAQGCVNCMAMTRKKRPCTLPVPGMTYLGPKEWVCAVKEGGYCRVHSGENSKL